MRGRAGEPPSDGLCRLVFPGDSGRALSPRSRARRPALRSIPESPADLCRFALASAFLMRVRRNTRPATRSGHELFLLFLKIVPGRGRSVERPLKPERLINPLCRNNSSRIPSVNGAGRRGEPASRKQREKKKRGRLGRLEAPSPKRPRLAVREACATWGALESAK